VTSTHPSLDDAAGDAAVRADAKSPEALASAIERALVEREQLSPLGLRHASRFTWRACGAAVLDGYERAL
jgi:glycosyltransferase involved in cell wall biosynthesis